MFIITKIKIINHQVSNNHLKSNLKKNSYLKKIFYSTSYTIIKISIQYYIQIISMKCKQGHLIFILNQNLKQLIMNSL